MPELPFKICVNFSFDRIFVLRVIWHFCFGGQHFKNPVDHWIEQKLPDSTRPSQLIDDGVYWCFFFFWVPQPTRFSL